MKLKKDNGLEMWLNHGKFLLNLTNEKRTTLLKRLTEVEGFEKFLHRTFVGQKRFSIEGVDTLVPFLDEIIAESVQAWNYKQ